MSKFQSQEWKYKISLAMTGKKRGPLSLEWRRKIGESESRTKKRIRFLRTGSWELPAKKGMPKGMNHWNWKGGVTSPRQLEQKKWAKQVFKRDNYTCQECGAKNGNGKTIKLEAHHKNSWWGHPELRSDLNNGVTLCKDCHKLTFKDSYGMQKKVVYNHYLRG